ncbi:MAG: hypothetical protein K2X87_07460 [Gemmataceae bacterium]|nr:hypothetical protein [Gemmataceae bacterium]
MAVSYTCPNPDCRASLTTPTPVPAGKRVKCPKCGDSFTPVRAEPTGGKAAPPKETFTFRDDPVKPGGKPAKPGKGAEPAPAKPDKPPPARPSRFADDEDDPDSVKKGYGVVQESKEEQERAERNKPKFGSLETKHRRSARGPAIALLVMPANLLTFEGLLTGIGGVVLFVVGVWPLVFNDASPGDEEIEEAIVYMLLGLLVFGWGAMVCFGASRMQELGSYLWATVGAVMGIVPLLVGLYAVIMLQNPKVKAGFEEVQGALDDDEEGGDEDEEEDEDDEDDD